MAGDSLGIKIIVKNLGFEAVVERVTAALKVEGFGILTEIDMKETMKKKLDVELLPYKILGACNPLLAYRALSSAPEVGLLLPCNVTVRALEGGEIEVSLVDPMVMLGVISDNPTLKAVAVEAKTRLVRVSATLDK